TAGAGESRSGEAACDRLRSVCGRRSFPCLKSNLDVYLRATLIMVASILAMALTLIVTLQGRIAPVIGSALAIEVAAFSVFVWPAWSFSANSPLNPDAPASGTPVS
ncbi:hypothetical protein, partial [Azotobacter chroococcum]|uniref:hypothetical protein n=1 Tax=Azotobacter chroococcum TaxID=353 RepID=UPI001B8C0226